MGWIKCVKKAIAVWEYFQVELHGQYSIERLQQFKQYHESTSPLRVFCVIVLTALPCLSLILLTDSVHLQDPLSVKGAAESSQLLFWARNLIVSGTLPFSLLMECRFLVTRLKMSDRLSLPFMLVTGGSGWCVLFVVCMHFGWGELIRRNPAVRVELAIYIKVLLVQMSLTVVYPAYTSLFLQLPASVQVFYSVPLLVVKLAAKNVMSRYLSGMDDVRPQEVIFNIEVFHALFISCSMQSSRTAFKTLFIMAIDGIQSLLTLYDVGGIIYELKESEKKFEIPATECARGMLNQALLILETNPTVCLHPTIHLQTRQVQSAHRLLKFEIPRQDGGSQAQSAAAEKLSAPIPSKALSRAKVAPTDEHHGSPCEELVVDAKGEGVSASKSTSATVLVGALLEDATSKQPILSSNDTCLLEYVQKTLKLFHLAEFLMLIEFVAVVIPVVYSCYLLGVSHLPNRVYYSQLRAMDDATLQINLRNVVIYSGLEWISFLAFASLLKRKVLVSPIYQLAFALESQWQVIQSKLVLWVLFMVQSSLDHYGKSNTNRIEGGSQSIMAYDFA